ncbi:MAG: MATE family efflux transporter [Firmicutes bacterium]|nr:MATE family efflux transporter [Bacillota bacterium]
MSHNELLKNEKIGKLLLKFSIPAIIGMVVNALYNVVDRMYIGWIGPLAMTGIGLSLPLMTLLMGFGMLVGIGAGSRISIKLGEGHQDEAERILGNAFTLLFFIMGVVMVLGLLFKTPLLYLFGASEATIGYADEYLTIILYGAIFQGLGFGLTGVMRSEGHPTIAMMTTIGAALTNIVLDPIFIFGLDMGIAGAALATILSQFFSMMVVIYHFTKGKSRLKLHRRNLKLSKTVVISIVSIGMSPFFMQVAASVVSVIANNSLKAYGGDIAIGAMTVINAIAIFFLMPIFGINQGTQPIVGYNYGAKEYGRVKQALKLAITAGVTVATTGFILTQFLTEPLVRIFNSDPELIAVATKGMRIFLSMLPLVGFQIISANYFQAVGKAPKAIFLSLLRQVLVLIPLLIILPKIFGLTGVWYAGPTADFVASLLTAIFLFKELRHLDERV